jgi:hypothetical protein
MNHSYAPATIDELLISLMLSFPFLSSVVNSRGELVPSPRANARNAAPCRWLGDQDIKGSTSVQRFI